MKVLLCALILCVFTVGFVFAEENSTEVVAMEYIIAVEETAINVTNETTQVVYGVSVEIIHINKPIDRKICVPVWSNEIKT